MRVIGGEFRGRRLRAPRGDQTRPTADRVREALFNVLAPFIADATVLDLFAGSGALGLEALSRGAASAVLVESDAVVCRVLRQNVATLDIGTRADIWQMPVQAALRRLGADGMTFDFIMLDPPYRQGLVDATVALLADGTVLAPDGIIVAEHERSAETAATVDTAHGSLVRVRTLTYGDTAISMYRRPEREGTDTAEEEDE